jgi:lysophospholipase L1-like esterase
MLPVRRVFLWFVPAIAGLATALVFAGGFAAGISGKLGQPVSDDLLPKPTPAPAAPRTGAFRIVALGDSLTRGAGDGSGGYPERVAKALRAAGSTVEVENLGVDGADTKDLLKKLADPESRRHLEGARLILMSISGNDLSHSFRGGPPGTGKAGEDPTAPAREAASSNLRSILSAVRDANGSAPIRLLGLYSPFPEGFDPLVAKRTLLAWNVALEEASYSVPGAVVVPTADLFAERPDRLAADRFHPGPAGYDEIAARIVSTLGTGARATSTARQSPP